MRAPLAAVGVEYTAVGLAMRLVAARASRVVLLLGCFGQAWAAPGEGEGCLPIPLAASLPLHTGDALVLGEPDRVDRQATLAPRDGGAYLLAYASDADGSMDRSELRLVEVDAGHCAGPARPWRPVPGASLDAPAVVGGWIHFTSVTRTGEQARLQLWRAPLRPGLPGQAERRPDIPGLRTAHGWPRWVDAGDGTTVVSYRADGNAPHWTALDDAGHPLRIRRIDPASRSAYVRVVRMTGGGWLLSYQHPPDGGYMATWFRISRDGEQWSAARQITESPERRGRPDVHDGYALPRRDAGVDLYYVYPSLKGGTAQAPIVDFDLYRRAVLADGTLGPEQALSHPADFNPYAPSAHRLADGRVLLTFADIAARGADGVSSARLVATRLDGDAPLPAARRHATDAGAATHGND